MPALKRDFIFEAGADFGRALYLAPGPDADLRNYTARMQVRPSVGSDTIVLELTTENGRIACDYGKVTLSVPDDVVVDTAALVLNGCLSEPSQSGDMPFTAVGPIGVYDLEVVSPSGIVTRLLSGKVVFSANVTR